MKSIVTAILILSAVLVAPSVAQDTISSQLVSYGKYAFQSSIYNGLNATKALDGSIMTVACTTGAANNYITVALLNVYRITAVKFWIPEHVVPGPPTVKVQRRLHNGPWIDCSGELAAATVQGNENVVSCNGTGSFVRIYQPSNAGHYLCVSEIEVYGIPSGKSRPLLSRRKSTIQSSTNNGQGNFASSYAVDGNIFDGKYSHTTGENRPWWRVDLEGLFSVFTVRIYAGVGTHLTPLTVDTRDEQGVWTSCDTVTDVAVIGGVYEVNCRAVVTSTVRIQAVNNGVYLILSEVEVFGVEADIDYSPFRLLNN